MNMVTEVIGNVYFCDFKSNERKMSHSFAPTSRRPGISPGEAAPQAYAHESASADRTHALTDPEVA